MRRSAILPPALALIGGLCAIPSASADPSPPPGSERVLAGVQIKPRAAGNLCLEVADANTGNGALVTLWPCTGNSNQRWIFDQGRIKSDLPGNKCLDVRGSNGANAAAINTYACHAGGAQQWSFVGHRIVSGLNGKCLTVVAGNFAGGATIANWECVNHTDQLWETS